MNATHAATIKKFERVSAIVGIVVGIAGVLASPTQFFRSYLFAFMFWFGMGIGCLGIVLLLHVVGGTWSDLIRPLLEAGASTLPWLAICFVPILFGIEKIYPWARADAVAGDVVLQHKRAYLNVPFFVLRAVACLTLWSLMAVRLNRWSDPRNAPLEERARRYSGVGLFIYFLTLLFCLTDWTMSLEPHWYSTIYQLMVVVGQALGALAFAVCGLALFGCARSSEAMPPKPLLDLGNMMLTLVMFWAYTAFSQYLIIWSGDIPDEISWYLHRQQGGWFWIAMVLIVFQFFLPFTVLLLRTAKARLERLAGVCALIVGVRILEVYWLIEPAFYPGDFHIHWLDVALPIGLGGVWCFAFLKTLERRPAIIVACMPEAAP